MVQDKKVNDLNNYVDWNNRAHNLISLQVYIVDIWSKDYQTLFSSRKENDIIL